MWQLSPLAAVCPSVGSMSDLMARRYVAILGTNVMSLGTIVASTAHSMNIFIGRSPFEIDEVSRKAEADLSAAGMAIAGAGAGINELTALAVTSELAPIRRRGTYVAILVFHHRTLHCYRYTAS